MTALLGLAVMLFAVVAIFAVAVWREVRLAQVTDKSIRGEWAEYKAEVNGAVDVLAKTGNRLNEETGEMWARFAEHDGRLKKLENDARTEGLRRVGGVR